MSDIDLTDTVDITPDPSELRDTATELLTAADDLGAPVESVASFGPGSFRVPRAVAEKAGIQIDDDDADEGEFDPSSHTVADVQAYLADADDAERQRVVDAEKAGKNRAGIVGGGDAAN